MLLLRAVNRRGLLKAANEPGYVGFRSPNSGVGAPLCSNPVPGVRNTDPRLAKLSIGMGNLVARRRRRRRPS